MIIMIRLIVFLLFLTTGNCQLAQIWLNYNLFQCFQNARNYHESLHHQCLCTSSFIRTCIADVNEYSHSSVIVPEYFCGFIDGQNALQRHTIWNIHLKPNIIIHFLKFVLFDYYWYCDLEYLRISSNNKSSSFCGNRLPWVHDATATSVDIILMTHVQRAGTKNYHLELLYYAASVLKYKHFLMFIQPSSTNHPLINIHLNALDSFHLISSNRLENVELEAMNICSKSQLICYDGPGFKSPVLQFTYNQSFWKCWSSTFQMVCKFSRVDEVCTNSPRLYYQAIRGSFKVQLKKFYHCPSYPLEINESKSKGTTKYIYSYSAFISKCMISFIKMDISFPYMLSEGNSCMYGGLYIVQWGSEVLSLCTSSVNVNRRFVGLNNLFVIIIHYSEYSTERILFHAEHSYYSAEIDQFGFKRDYKQRYKENTLSITATLFHSFIHSSIFRLRKIHYINISVNESVFIESDTQYRSPCVNVAIFHPLDLTCMWFILYHDKENGSWKIYNRTTTLEHRTLRKSTFIESIVINMSAYSFVRDPSWEMSILLHQLHSHKLPEYTYSGIERFSLPASAINVPYFTRRSNGINTFRQMIHMQKPENAPVHNIWRVWIYNNCIGLRAFIEVFLDHSSSWYTWDNASSSTKLYITFNKAINIMLESNSVGIYENYANCLWGILFTRDFHDEKITKYIRGQISQQFHFSFHKRR